MTPKMNWWPELPRHSRLQSANSYTNQIGRGLPATTSPINIARLALRAHTPNGRTLNLITDDYRAGAGCEPEKCVRLVSVDLSTTSGLHGLDRILFPAGYMV